MRSKFQMVLSSWRHALKSTNHSAKVCLRTAVNLEKTNAQAPNGKKLVVTAVSQWAVYECKSGMQHCSKKGKPGFWTYSWAWNSRRLEWNLSTLLVTDGLLYLIKGSTIDLLRKVQGIKIFRICKHSNGFGETRPFISSSKNLKRNVIRSFSMSEPFLHIGLQKQDKNHHLCLAKRPRVNTRNIFLMIMVIRDWNMAKY